MDTCGNPFLNEWPLEGLRQGVCATPWFQYVLAFIVVLQCFHHMSMLFFVCVLVLFFGSAPGSAPYIYIYMAFRMHLHQGLRQLFFSCAVCISYVFGAFSMQSCLCTCKQSSFHWAFPWYFLYVPRIFSIYFLVSPSIGLHQSFPFLLGWWFPLHFLYASPPYISNIFTKQDLRQVCASHFFWDGICPLFFLCFPWLSYICPYAYSIRPRHAIIPTVLAICLTFSIISLKCSRTALGDCSSFSYIFQYYSILTGDWCCHSPCGETCWKTKEFKGNPMEI